jgi:hypothetical protein
VAARSAGDFRLMAVKNLVSDDGATVRGNVPMNYRSAWVFFGAGAVAGGIGVSTFLIFTGVVRLFFVN